MAAKAKALSDDDYIANGRHYRSEEVNKEANAAIQRWQLHMSELVLYGLGQRALEELIGLVTEHTAFLASRPDAVIAKLASVEERNATIAEGWTWCERIHAALSWSARGNKALADALNNAYPADTAALGTAIPSLAALLDTYVEQVDPEFPAREMIAAAEPLAERIRMATASAVTAKSAPVQDTRAVDLLDGKIISAIVQLNRAGRKAFDNETIKSSFRFQFLGQRRSSGGGAPEAEDATP
jgi:hypothetical protein